jgi:hypothetical protein
MGPRRKRGAAWRLALTGAQLTSPGSSHPGLGSCSALKNRKKFEPTWCGLTGIHYSLLPGRVQLLNRAGWHTLMYLRFQVSFRKLTARVGSRERRPNRDSRTGYIG